jgi:uncharacterized membrane protein (DUF2068 family)
VSEVRRPVGVGLIAALLAASAIVSLVGALLALGLGGIVLPDAERSSSSFVAAGYVALAVAQVVVSWGFWTLRGWAWTVGILLQGLNVVIGLVQLLLVGVSGIGVQGLASIVVAVVVIAYLTRRRTLDAFVLRSLERMDEDAVGRKAP